MKRKWRQLIESLILKFKAMKDLTNFEIFGNLMLQGLESGYINSINFPENFLPDINSIKEKLMRFSDDLMLGYELKEIIQYSDENDFFERYLLCDDGDKSIINNINWFLEYGQKLLIQSKDYKPDDLAEFMVNGIFYSYLNRSKKGMNKPKSKKYSYQWLGKPDELKDLFERMKGNFLSNDNKLDDFIKVFSNVEVCPNLKPIRWNNDNASEVLFFIKSLKEKGLIGNFNRMDYYKMKLLFVKPDGSLFDGDLKVSYNRLDIDFSHKKQKELGNLLNGFL